MRTVKFNLKAALKNPERVIYRNGEKPKEWHWLSKGLYSIKSIKPNGDFESHIPNGSVYFSIKSEYDLLLIADDKKPK